jgi:hypothetical protein
MTDWCCSVKSNRSKSAEVDQHKRFIETARALECDEDKERFEAKMKQISKDNPPQTKHK